jgi:hypothetical protein
LWNARVSPKLHIKGHALIRRSKKKLNAMAHVGCMAPLSPELDGIA